METVDTRLEFLYAERQRRQIEEEREHLSTSFKDFIRGAWAVMRPDNPFIPNWHIDAICEHLEAVSTGEIKRLQIWIPPQSMKSYCVSILWPAWEWTTRPGLLYWTASYGTRLAWRNAARSHALMNDDWYKARWGHEFSFVRDAEDFFMNDRGGYRLSTSPGSEGTGYHGDRIIIDDPIEAAAADATSQSKLGMVNDWYDGTVESRGQGPRHARVIIMQRLHELDLCGHALEKENWTVLCLPERYEHDHPHAWKGDPRREGDLLWPEWRPETASNAMAAGMTSHRAAGQLQQRPAAREGEILKRGWWRFYDPAVLIDKTRSPRFSVVVQSIDTPSKDKESNDLIAIQAWGVSAADRYLLDLRKGHLNYGQAKRAIVEQARHVRRLYPRAAHYCLLENAGYGVELIEELKRELPGVLKVSAGLEGNKQLRAEAAAADLEAGNCWLPGFGQGEVSTGPPDEKRTPADIIDFVNECGTFPHGRYDDQVDAWSQAMNWIRNRPSSRARFSSPFTSNG